MPRNKRGRNRQHLYSPSRPHDGNLSFPGAHNTRTTLEAQSFPQVSGAIRAKFGEFFYLIVEVQKDQLGSWRESRIAMSACLTQIVHKFQPIRNGIEIV